ncbi:MAG: hypothetical protein FWE04_03265 [Oscillospiraceae bacterium]|nr:hypothetical protein [Oscillospiraceae bacterium]
MASVTRRIKAIKQPKGGYINPKLFQVTEIDESGLSVDLKSENIQASIIGTAVDYLTRVLSYNNPFGRI